MSIPAPAIERLEEIVRSHNFAVTGADSKNSVVGEDVASALMLAKSDHEFWQKLSEWKRTYELDVDLDALRSAISYDLVDSSPESILKTIGVAESESADMLRTIREQLERDVAVEKAFSHADPTQTAQALEQVVEKSKNNAPDFLSISASFSVTSIIVYMVLLYALYLVVGAIQTQNTAVFLYKGVTPQRAG